MRVDSGRAGIRLNFFFFFIKPETRTDPIGFSVFQSEPAKKAQNPPGSGRGGSGWPVGSGGLAAHPYETYESVATSQCSRR
jgi:hypothetical protein